MINFFSYTGNELVASTMPTLCFVRLLSLYFLSIFASMYIDWCRPHLICIYVYWLMSSIFDWNIFKNWNCNFNWNKFNIWTCISFLKFWIDTLTLYHLNTLTHITKICQRYAQYMVVEVVIRMIHISAAPCTLYSL